MPSDCIVWPRMRFTLKNDLIHIYVHEIKEKYTCPGKEWVRGWKGQNRGRDNSYAKVAALVPWSVGCPQVLRDSDFVIPSPHSFLSFIVSSIHAVVYEFAIDQMHANLTTKDIEWVDSQIDRPIRKVRAICYLRAAGEMQITITSSMWRSTHSTWHKTLYYAMVQCIPYS